MHGRRIRARCELADCQRGQCRVAAPLAFASHDEIEVETVQQTHEPGARRYVDADENFVEQNELRSVRRRTAVMRGRRGKLRQRQSERLFAAGTGAVGLLGQFFPLAVLKALDGEPVPSAIVQRSAEVLLPRRRLIGGAFGIDAP